MFVLGRSTKWFAAAMLAVFMLTVAVTGGAVAAQAQSKRQRRETNANRQARINRAIADTYTRRYEVFGGGGFLRFRSGEYLQRNSEITWASSGTYFLNEKLGISGDVRGAFGDAKIPNVFVLNGAYRPLINEYTFMGGPTYRIYLREKYAISAFVGGGIAIGNFNGGTHGIDSPLLGMWKSNNRPVIGAGVNFDYNFFPNLAFRFTPTLLGTTFQGTTATGTETGGSSTGGFQPNLGFNAGIVYRFGRIK